MIFTRVKAKNWKNFREVEFRLSDRMFIVGPNAAGKSNLLDIFRFLRDIAMPGGGLQRAIGERGGLSKIRCLAARRFPNVEIEVDLADSPDTEPRWRYGISIRQESHGRRNALLVFEKVWCDGVQILDRPEDDAEDKEDPLRLTETFLEHTNTNAKFREIANVFSETQYMHLVPQLLRFPWMFAPPATTGNGSKSDPFGLNFLERLANSTEGVRRSRLARIEKALRLAIPNFEELTFSKDKAGRPHLEVKYKHWRPLGARQSEDQFSDGTLRLIGLLWSLLEGNSLLLLEEPELSLNHSIVRQIPRIVHSANRDRKRRRQVIMSTHSEWLLSSNEIGLDEILILLPSAEGTEAILGSSKAEIVQLLEGGMTPGEAIMPSTEPDAVAQLGLFSP